MPVSGINNNIAYRRAITDMSRADRQGGVHRERLPSGTRLNSGRDGAGHLAESEGMRGEIGGLTAGARNAEKAIDQIRTAEGSVSEVSSILIRMRERATQASSGTLNDSNREALDSEFNQLKEYIDRIAKLASYNNQSLLSGFATRLTNSSRRPSPIAPTRASVVSFCPALPWAATPSLISRATTRSPSVMAP